MRSGAYRRFQREKHIKRKENILRRYRLDNPPHYYDDEELFPIELKGKPLISKEGMWFPYWAVAARGCLDKGKIHCGCGMCMSKTRNKGKRRMVHGNYAPAINYKHSELKKIQKMNYDKDNWEKEIKENNYELAFDEKYGWLKNKISEERYNKLKYEIF